MYVPYVPCEECKHKDELCEQCAFKNAEKNYDRALAKIAELSDELGKKITILV